MRDKIYDTGALEIDRIYLSNYALLLVVLLLLLLVALLLWGIPRTIRTVKR